LWRSLEDGCSKLLYLRETVRQIKVKALEFTAIMEKLMFPEKKVKVRFVYRTKVIMMTLVEGEKLQNR
jgi:hypothetical protein